MVLVLVEIQNQWRRLSAVHAYLDDIYVWGGLAKFSKIHIEWTALA
jgi:hypothetical protein